MAQDKRSWIEGPAIPAQGEDPSAPGRWPGEKLGLPRSGAGSLASVLRRAVGVAVDWAIASGVAWLLRAAGVTWLGGPATSPYLVFLLIGMLTGVFFARTPGQWALGMGIARVDVPGATIGVWRPVARTLMTGFIFPAIMVDADGRGIHDRATGTAVVRG